MHRELGVRAAHSDVLHLKVGRFSVLVSSLDEECVAQGPAWGGDGGMCVYGGNTGLPALPGPLWAKETSGGP